MLNEIFQNASLVIIELGNNGNFKLIFHLFDVLNGKINICYTQTDREILYAGKHFLYFSNYTNGSYIACH